MRRTCAAPHSIAPPGIPCVKKQLLSLRTRVSQLSSIDEQSGSSAHNHSTTLVPGHAAAAPGSATPELDSTHRNGLIDDKKRSVVPTVQCSGREWGVACASYSLCNLKGLSCYLLVVPPVLAECMTGDRVPAGICRAHMGEDA